MLISWFVSDGHGSKFKDASSETGGTATARHRQGTANATAAPSCGDSLNLHETPLNKTLYGQQWAFTPRAGTGTRRGWRVARSAHARKKNAG
eukprot:987105-Alexandrium_andersonii.AAC.1